MRRTLWFVPLALGLVAAPARAEFDHPTSPLTIPTHDNYNNSGQVVEPDVAYRPQGWNNYKYWMAVTPYPCGSEVDENPSIVASNDGQSWVEPTGISNPISGFGTSTRINNDPTILFVGDTLVVYYCVEFRDHGLAPDSTRLMRMWSLNGSTWNSSGSVYTKVGGHILSPSIVLINGTYYFYYIDTPSCGPDTSTVSRLRSTNGRVWTNLELVSIDKGTKVPFHLTVKWTGDRFAMLYAAYASGSSCGFTSLYYADGSNGTSFTGTVLILAPKSGNWDSVQIYRSTFVATGRYLRIWYSARGDYNNGRTSCPAGLYWYAGYTQGCLESQCFTNAAVHDTLPTYDGANQVVDPDLVYVPGAWKGYEYWMAMTPYTCGDELTENPSILASHEGRHWIVPTNNGTPINPIAPGSGSCNTINGDPTTLLVGDSLLVYYTVQHRTGLSTYQTDVKRLASNDGVHWTSASSAPVVYSKSGYFLSPSVVLVNGTYYMYYVDATTCTGLTQNAVKRLQSSNGFSWSTVQTTTISNAPNVIFHLLVKWTGDHYAMLYAAYPALSGFTCGNTSLYYASSTDGLSWTGRSQVILTPNVGSWDDAEIYRAAFVPTTNGLRIWYSARSTTTCTPGSACSGNNPWYVGYTEGCLGDDCTAPSTISLSASAGCYDHIYLSWVAPGDDGSTGTATAYDLRWSTSTITDANFSGATSISTSSPQPAGSYEQMTVYVPYCSGRRYYAIKARDEANNWSALSNVPFSQPACPHPPLQCYERAGQAPTGEPEPEQAPTNVELTRPEPNPAGRNGFGMRYGVPAMLDGVDFELSVFDLVGRRLATLDRGRAAIGYHQASWDLRTSSGDRVERGVYFVKLRLGSVAMTHRVVVLE